jgi:hypothetical protein
MAVFFQCKSCEGEHRSTTSFVDRQSFEASPMPELRFVCRITGAATSYRRTDMYWRADLRGPEDVVPSSHRTS